MTTNSEHVLMISHVTMNETSVNNPRPTRFLSGNKKYFIGDDKLQILIE